MLRAGDFEFKFRFWIFGALFWLAFATYAFDQQNAGAVLLDHIAKWRGLPPPSDRAYRVLFALGALVCFAGAALRTWATAYLQSAVMVDSRLHSSRLVADGPYRYVRNPLYLGNAFVAIGFGLMASRVGFCVLVGGMILFNLRLIGREEGAVLQNQGESYRAYRSSVPKLLPSLRACLPASGARPSWEDGFIGEAFMWLLAASVLAFAITLKLSVFWAVLVSAFVAYAICYAVIRARQKKAAR